MPPCDFFQTAVCFSCSDVLRGKDSLWGPGVRSIVLIDSGAYVRRRRRRLAGIALAEAWVSRPENKPSPGERLCDTARLAVGPKYRCSKYTTVLSAVLFFPVNLQQPRLLHLIYALSYHS